jgi:hypothetical protein
VSGSAKILGFIALVASWTLVAGAPASAADCGPVNTQVTGLSQGQMESSIGCLINEERTSYGLQPVTPTGTCASRRCDRIHAGHPQLGGRREPGLGHRAAEHTALPGRLLDEQPSASREPAQADLPGDRDRGRRRDTVSRSDLTGVTVSSEYGDRNFGKANKGKAHKSKAKKAKAKKARAKHRARR